MKLNYVSRKVSTLEIDDLNFFDPPLVFAIRAKAQRGWINLVSQLDDSETYDLSTIKRILSGICLSVSDGDTTQVLATVGGVDAFHDLLKKNAPEIADELLYDIAFNLAVEFIDYHRERREGLKKISPQSNDGRARDKAGVSVSSANYTAN